MHGHLWRIVRRRAVNVVVHAVQAEGGLAAEGCASEHTRQAEDPLEQHGIDRSRIVRRRDVRDDILSSEVDAAESSPRRAVNDLERRPQEVAVVDADVRVPDVAAADVQTIEVQVSAVRAHARRLVRRRRSRVDRERRSGVVRRPAIEIVQPEAQPIVVGQRCVCVMNEGRSLGVGSRRKEPVLLLPVIEWNDLEHATDAVLERQLEVVVEIEIRGEILAGGVEPAEEIRAVVARAALAGTSVSVAHREGADSGGDAAAVAKRLGELERDVRLADAAQLIQVHEASVPELVRAHDDVGRHARVPDGDIQVHVGVRREREIGPVTRALARHTRRAVQLEPRLPIIVRPEAEAHRRADVTFERVPPALVHLAGSVAFGAVAGVVRSRATRRDVGLAAEIDRGRRGAGRHAQRAHAFGRRWRSRRHARCLGQRGWRLERGDRIDRRRRRFGARRRRRFGACRRRRFRGRRWRASRGRGIRCGRRAGFCVGGRA